VTLAVTYPAPVSAGMQYWKYGPTPGNPTPQWYVLPATFSGSTVTFTITDGGLGDDDLAVNGAIVDQGGPGAVDGARAVPTLSEWSLIALALLLGAFGMRQVRRRA
jgi:hypothetical protein